MRIPFHVVLLLTTWAALELLDAKCVAVADPADASDEVDKVEPAEGKNRVRRQVLKGHPPSTPDEEAEREKVRRGGSYQTVLPRSVLEYFATWLHPHPPHLQDHRHKEKRAEAARKGLVG